MTTAVTSFTPNVVSIPPERTPLSFSRTSAQPVMQPVPVATTPVVSASPVRVVSPAVPASPVRVVSPAVPASPVVSVSPVRTVSPTTPASPVVSVSPVRTVSPTTPVVSASPVRVVSPTTPAVAPIVSPVRPARTVSPVRSVRTERTVSPVRSVRTERTGLNMSRTSPLRSTLRRLSPSRESILSEETPLVTSSSLVLSPELSRLNLSEATLSEPVFVTNGSPLESTTERLESVLEDQHMSPIQQYVPNGSEFSIVKAVSPDGHPVYIEVEQSTLSVPMGQVVETELHNGSVPKEYVSLVEAAPGLKTIHMVLECDNGICVVKPDGENLTVNWLMKGPFSSHKHVHQAFPLIYMKDLLGKDCARVHSRCVDIHKLLYKHMCLASAKLHKEREHALECLKMAIAQLVRGECGLLLKLESEREKFRCRKKKLHCTNECICGKGALLKNVSKNIIVRDHMMADLFKVISLASSDAAYINELTASIKCRMELYKHSYCEKRLSEMRQ